MTSSTQGSSKEGQPDRYLFFSFPFPENSNTVTLLKCVLCHIFELVLVQHRNTMSFQRSSCPQLSKTTARKSSFRSLSYLIYLFSTPHFLEIQICAIGFLSSLSLISPSSLFSLKILQTTMPLSFWQNIALLILCLMMTYR